MKITKHLLALTLGALTWMAAAAEGTSPQSVGDLLDRVCGTGASGKITYILDPAVEENGQETFIITSEGDKPCVKGSTLSALTTGLGWYLNHHLNVNLSWNHITDPTLATIDWPAPAAEEKHSSRAIYRYYLNYCTMSYSMSTWTWDRWAQEIDWMALRGINMPLVITGLEEVWRKFLRDDYGYTEDEVDDFVAGPAYVAWWGMGNLEGAGNPKQAWWYERQAKVGKQIVKRMTELGIDPVLPGFYMLPRNFGSKQGVKTFACGAWCNFPRPFYPKGDEPRFHEIASKYYARLHEVYGITAKYYSMDPFHEGGLTEKGLTNADYDALYVKLHEEMKAASPDSKYVIQSWQWNAAQWRSIQTVPVGDLIVLDLYSDGKPGWGNYGNHDVVYSTIFNFGARTGFFGRFNGVIDGYFKAVASKPTVKGVGAAPEGIEQTPVMYDILFELPWHATKPDAAQWMKEYAQRRYSVQDNPEAEQCWELLRNSALNCQTSLQGPHEGIICGRPALNINKVSSWGGSEIFYDTSMTAEAVYRLLKANGSGENYSYDLTDLSRQALADYSKLLLAEINAANTAKDTERFAATRDTFLQLILDVDELCNTNKDFMLGHWTELSRGMANDVAGTTVADQDMLEANNARQLITTWGPQTQAEGGGLRDYSYRMWGGMLKDFYYQRWKIWFDNGMKVPSGGWFAWEWNWAHTLGKHYPTTPIGNTREVAQRVLPKYLTPFTPLVSADKSYYVPRMLTTNRIGKTYDRVARGVNYLPALEGVTDADVKEFAIDFNNTKTYTEDEISAGHFLIPDDAKVGEHQARLTLTDGTVFSFTLVIFEDIADNRTVTVAIDDKDHGTVSIDGSTTGSITNKEPVVIRATNAAAFDFDYWEDADGNNLGNDNPFTYYGKDPLTLTAKYVVNKWGVPVWAGSDSDKSFLTGSQYLTTLSVVQNGETRDVYTDGKGTGDHFIYLPVHLKAAPGAEFTFNYAGASGLVNTYLTAYVDINEDGIFDINSDELLGHQGKTGEAAGKTSGSFTTLLPYEAQLGTTHIRLRFDSAWWNTKGNYYNEEKQAFLPDAATNRFVVEILLDFEEAAEYATNVTVGINNPAYGDVRSENSTNIYEPGEEVILTAFPKDGFRVVGWQDKQGRMLPEKWLSDENRQCRFKAYDNQEITAILEPLPMELCGWTFGWDYDEHGRVTLKEIIEEGDPNLDLSAENTAGVAIEAIAEELFQGNTTLQSVTLPANLVCEHKAKGHGHFETSLQGAGIEDQRIDLPFTLKGDQEWSFTLEYDTNWSTFNQYGSCILASGETALWGGNYPDGFQFYLDKNKQMLVKYDANPSYNGGLGMGTGNVNTTHYKYSFAYHITNARIENLTDTYWKGTFKGNNESQINDIDHFLTALPVGVNITSLVVDADNVTIKTPYNPGELFRGCYGLQDIHVQDGSTYVERDGVLYLDGNCAGYPEGRLVGAPLMLQTATGEHLYAEPVMAANGNYTETEAKVGDVSATPLKALWNLQGDGKLNHANSGLSAHAAQSGWQMVYGLTEPAISFTAGEQHLNHAEGKLVTADEAHPFRFTIANELTVGEKTSTEPIAISFPVPVMVTEETEVYGVNEIKADGTATIFRIPAYVTVDPQHAVISLEGMISLPAVQMTLMADAPENKLLGTNAARVATSDYWLLEGTKFTKGTANSTIPANAAYVEVPAELQELPSLELDTNPTLGIEEPSTINYRPSTIYDLLGRRLATPTRGINIINGQKVKK